MKSLEKSLAIQMHDLFPNSGSQKSSAEISAIDIEYY